MILNNIIKMRYGMEAEVLDRATEIDKEEQISNIFIHKYTKPINIMYFFDTSEKVIMILEYLYLLLIIERGTMKGGKLDMIPFTYNNASKSKEYLTIDYNFLVFVIGNFIRKYNLGNSELFIEQHKLAHNLRNNQNHKNSIALTETILENYLGFGYISNGKYNIFSIKQVWENNSSAYQFAGVNFDMNSLKNFLLYNNDFYETLVDISKEDSMKQVAFSTSCEKYWLSDKRKNAKRFFIKL